MNSFCNVLQSTTCNTCMCRQKGSACAKFYMARVMATAGRTKTVTRRRTRSKKQNPSSSANH
eukprot:1057265-Amphidinium_carterae.1